MEHQNHANQNLIADLQSKIAASAVTRGVHSSSHTKRPSNDDDGMPEVSMADIITHPVSSSGGGPYSHSRNHSPERVVRIKEGSSSSAYSATAAALASSDLGGMVRPVSQSHTRSPDQMVVRVGEVSGTGSIGSTVCSAMCRIYQHEESSINYTAYTAYIQMYICITFILYYNVQYNMFFSLFRI